MSTNVGASGWQQAFRMADPLLYILAWAAKRQAIRELLETLRQAIMAGRQVAAPALRNTADA